MARRHYSDEERAAALAALRANGGNVSKTAREVGVPRKTLKHWLENENRAAPAELRQEKKLGLAASLERLAAKLIGITDAKADDMSGKDAMIACGIAIEKMQLLNGDPTNISEERSADLTPDEQHDILTRLHDRLTSAPAANGARGQTPSPN